MRWIAVVAVALMLAGCGGDDTPDVTGLWEVKQSDWIFDIAICQQDGGTLSGTAREQIFGIDIFKNVPVSGVYPDVTFTLRADQLDSCCKNRAGRIFRGSFDRDKTLRGEFQETEAEPGKLLLKRLAVAPKC